MRLVLIAAAFAVPVAAFAAGQDDSPPKSPTVFCSKGKVYDADLKKCVKVQESSLDTEELYQTVRQLAYAGRYQDAQIVLDAMPENDARRLTYMGFTHRKMGNTDLGMTYYQAALKQDPTNILARSYMGQGLVEQGNVAQAIVQLKAIRAHGGTGTWPETSLRKAIATGTTYSY